MESHEQHTTNQNDSLVTETHTKIEEVIINNPDDPLSTVTQKLEDIHVTVTEQPPSTTTHGLSTIVEENNHLCLIFCRNNNTRDRCSSDNGSVER